MKMYVLTAFMLLTFSCSEVITPEPLVLDNVVFNTTEVIEDVLVFTALELGPNEALLTWKVDSSRLSETNLEVITGIWITYNYPIRPPRNFPFASGSMVHPLRANESLHCFTGFAYKDMVANSLPIESSICETN